MRRFLVAASAVAALVLPASAAAQTIELGWREDDGAGVMSFRVTDVRLANGRWSAGVAFTNRSTVALRITERRFALTGHRTARSYVWFRVWRATAFSPTTPTTLRPGRTWRGRFRGTPSPLPEFPNGFSWLTAHTHRLP